MKPGSDGQRCLVIGQPRVRKLRVLHHQYALVWAACAAPKAAELQLGLAAAAMAKRTKYNLEKMPAPLFPASLDKMSDATGARIVDAATGEATIDGVVGESPSTLFSATGSLFVWTIFAVSALTFYEAYYEDSPAINEQVLDVENDFSAPMPDFAVTLALQPRDFYIASQIRQIKAADGSLT